MDDCTVDCPLVALGLRTAEATGLRAELQALIAQRPLAGTDIPPLTAADWEQQVSPQATAALGTAHLARNGACASLSRSQFWLTQSRQERKESLFWLGAFA